MAEHRARTALPTLTCSIMATTGTSTAVALQPDSCPVPATSTAPTATLTKGGKGACVFLPYAAICSFPLPFETADEKSKYWKVILCIS